jgi:endoglucanase
MRFTTAATLALAASLATTAFAQITPTRVGPVSQYGQLMTGKNSSGKGQIYGSCEGVKDGAEVQVRGMSLYWSLMPQAVEYWSEEGVSTMVRDMNIQIVRAAMATGNEDWSNGYKGYGSDPTTQMNLMKTVVEAAIKNDIYVIIDWHSHNANEQTESAKNFFKQMAQTYGQYDNVIFELFNEPTDIAWGTIKNYADQVVSVIREYSDNLILVGTPKWDQNPQAAIGNEVSDSKKNTAYTLHYYANSHCWSGQYDWGGTCEGTNGEQAMNAGLSVFVSEWGTADASGGGDPNQSRNQSWQEYINKHKLSWANWSASYISEGTAAFQNGSSKTSLQYTTSGNLVKGYLSSNPTSYTACKANVPEPESSSSSTITAIPFYASSDRFNASVQNGTLSFTSTASGVTNIQVFDMLGNTRVQMSKQLGSGSHSIALGALPAGSYLVRVQQGTNLSQVRFQMR